MRLKKVKAHGFGKWRDTEWDLSADSRFTVFLGENETGKSSVMQLIHAVLFGFAKEEVERLKPRNGGNFGGSVELEMDGRTLTVERTHRQRIRGEVTVKYEDGRTGGEKEWEAILQGLDSATFKGIFHIDLNGLEHLQRLSPGEVNRYLYDAGMSGGQALTKLEKKLKQRADDYYTPQGKVKPVNRLAKEWEKTESERALLAEKLDRISEKRRLISDYENRLAEQADQEDEINQRLRFFEKASALETIIRDWSALNKKRDELARKRPDRFPVNGLERFERWQQLAEEKKAEAADKQKKLAEKKQLLAKEENLLLTDQLRLEMSNALEKKAEIMRLYDNRATLSKDIEQLNREKKKLLKAHPDTSADHFNAAVIDAQKLQQFDRLKNERVQLKSKEEQLKMKAEDIENRVADNQEMQEEAKRQEKNYLAEENRLAKQQEKKANRKITWILTGTVLAAGISLVAADLFIALMALAAGTALLFSAYKEKREWLDRRQRTEDTLSKADQQSAQESSPPLMAEKAINEKSLQQEKEQIELERERLAKQWSEWEDAFHNWLTITQLPFKDDLGWYDHFIPNARKWYELEDRIEELTEDKQQTESQIEQGERSAKQIVQKAGNTTDQEDFWYTLYKQYDRDEERRREIAKQQDLLTDMIEQHDELEEKYNHYRAKLDELLTYTGVTEENRFRSLGELEKHYEDIDYRCQEQEIRLSSAIPDKDEREKITAAVLAEHTDIDKEKQHLHEQSAAVFTEKERLIKEKTETAKEVETLEQDGTYEEICQEKKRLEEEVNKLLREWAVMQAALKMIGQAKRVYEQNRQPAVMERAEQLFIHLTEGRYHRFFAPLGEETFYVERNDGERFEPADLSRGTREILYLSLRLALADDDAFERKYPIIMDEILVNIDAVRRKKLIEAFSLISSGRQLLFFTCHRNLYKEIKNFTDDHTLHLLDSAVQR
ncbi:AAA family ATPase [Salisediminibacterium halotolerans]|uniref:Uncharacterized protein YhaN n=1 Tax=Salisediminibacterium halotolerans TaxID=517425 RepID=A0A1H9THV8_9BACI|nr:AAA family ATPase [Salisediminibacterium haloalkalitolerans]SER96564.1 Uncharacterized protein YhaN [Salisediminibacterium haloalkalitolerans]